MKNETQIQEIANTIRTVSNFPKKGIHFKDITPVLQDPRVFRLAVKEMARLYNPNDFDVVAGLEARGFIVGVAVAYELGKPFVPIRKAGKLPYTTIKENYGLEYGKDSVEIHTDAVRPGQRVLLLDDLLATGGTLKAGANLVERIGGTVAGMGVLVELRELQGRAKLSGYDVRSLISYED